MEEIPRILKKITYICPELKYNRHLSVSEMAGSIMANKTKADNLP